MTSAEVLLQSGPLSEEFQCDLGDRRRSERVVAMAAALAERPDESFPEVYEDPSDLEGAYRLLRNGAVDFDSLLAGHLAATQQRAKSLGRVAVLHDTTEFHWSRREATRWGVAKLSAARQGFFGHASFVVSAEGLRCPLGCIRLRPYVRPDDLADDEMRQWWAERFPAWERSEYQRWPEAVVATEEALGDVADVVHVMDREGDAYETFHLLHQRDWSYVIRLAQIRNAIEPATGEQTKIDKALQRAAVQTERTVQISERIDDGRTLHQRRAFPARSARRARLSIRACSVHLCRPVNRDDQDDLDDRIPVNLVEVVELEPPEGEEPVRWMLITSEPIETVEQVLQVVDLYRSRWVIEEYFKAIKTGCAYRKRQLDSIVTLLNALAITLPIAWRLLALRHLEREAPQAPAGKVVSRAQLLLLQRAAKKCKWSRTPTLSEVLTAVARLGGHIKSNGRPGWQVLGRGWSRLMTLEAGYQMALELQEAGML